MPGLRSLVEAAVRTLVLRRRLPAEAGGAPVFVSPSAGLKYLFRSPREWDKDLFKLAAEFVKEEMVVWDVGANLGMFSFAAAHRAGPKGSVVAIEADIFLAQLLRRSAALQPASSAPVRVLPAAAGASVAPRSFFIANRMRAANHLEGYGNAQAGGGGERQDVVGVTLDWLAGFLPPPDVVKIDVEGAELEVLKGAEGLLGGKRPVILAEVDPKNSMVVAGFLKGLGYKIYTSLLPKVDRKELDNASWATIALPGGPTG